MLPEGSMILYVDSDACTVKAVGIDGGEKITLTTRPPDYDWWGPAFSPEGKKLAFVLNDGNYDLYVMDLDGSGLPMFADAMAFAWSPDSRQLVYQNYDSGTQRGALAIVNADGSGAYTLDYADISICTTCDADIAISWSPDGQWIYAPADLEFPESGPVTPNIFRVDGEEHRQLGKEEVSIFAAAAWSPESQFLALPALDPAGEGCGELHLFGLDGDERTLHAATAYKQGEPGIAPSCFWGDFLWSPDGESILASGYPEGEFAAGEVKYDRILVTSVRSENVGLLEYWPGHPGASLWSPDGSQIVFVSSRDMETHGGSGLLVIMHNDPNSPEFRTLAETARNSPGALF